MSQNLTIVKGMKNKVRGLDWKELFNKIEQNRKIGYDVMYSEDIEILKNDYEKYKMDYFIDIFFEKGEFCFELDAEKYAFTSPTALVFQPNSEFRFISCDNPVIYIVIVSKKIRGDLLDTHAKNISFHSKMKIRPFAYLISEEDIREAQHYMFGAKEIISATDNPYRLEAFTHFNIYRYYFFFYRMYNINSSEDYGRCEKFFLLLEENFLKERDVDFYAKSLNISKGHLNLLLKKKTGKTIRYHIDSRLLVASKQLLLETNKSIETIARELKFRNSAAFSKFYRKMTGLTPSESRK